MGVQSDLDSLDGLFAALRRNAGVGAVASADAPATGGAAAVAPAAAATVATAAGGDLSDDVDAITAG
jgi:hypothetical protein